MNRLTTWLAAGALLGLVLVSLAAHAQPPEKVFRVGRLSSSTTPEGSEAFKPALRELGWNVGRTLLVELRDTKGNREQLRPFAKELVAMNVDVIVAAGNDAVAQLLKEVLPSARVVGVLTQASGRGADLEHIEAASRSLGLEIRRVPLRAAADLDGALQQHVAKRRVDALYVLPSAALLDGLRKRIADFAIRERIPTIGALPFHAEAGFLLAYGASNVAWSRRSAYFVDRILRGTPPGDLPVEQPTTFELTVNLKTARSIGIAIPHSLRLRADRVIE